MSDCSTKAMEPKERRTCGNCGHGVQSNVFCRESDGSTSGLHSLEERGCKKWVRRGYVVDNEALQGFADRIASLVGMEDMADCPCGLVDIYHATKSRISEVEAVEQRHKRLAQVAREMLELLEATIDPSCEERCPVYAFLPGQDNCIKQFREQLEECGVSVDDI